MQNNDPKDLLMDAIARIQWLKWALTQLPAHFRARLPWDDEHGTPTMSSGDADCYRKVQAVIGILRRAADPCYPTFEHIDELSDTDLRHLCDEAETAIQRAVELL